MPQGNNFITNSTGTKSIRKDQVIELSIEDVPNYDQSGGVDGISYVLKIRTDDVQGQFVIFETGDTLAAMHALAATVLAALEL